MQLKQSGNVSPVERREAKNHTESADRSCGTVIQIGHVQSWLNLQKLKPEIMVLCKAYEYVF